MRRRDLLALLGATAVSLPLTARAQQKAPVPTIGVLIDDDQNERGVRLFRQGLYELGYVEGQNINIVIRSADARLERLPELAAELVRRQVDLIAAISTPTALAAKNATDTIPIVIAVADPVANGVVPSLSRPGGNITGVSSVNAALGGKQVELLREVVPSLGRIGALIHVPDAFSKPLLESIKLFGKAQQIEIVAFPINGGGQLESAFAEMLDKRVEAVILQGSLPLKQAADLALRSRLPAGAPRKLFALNGGLMAYSPNGPELLRSMAALADKILKGDKPADLPVEQPTRFELVINLKTAKALGLTVPQSLLARADEVME